MGLSDAVATNIKEKQDLAVQIGAAGSVTTFFSAFPYESISPSDSYIIINTRTRNGSFILGDATLGKMGDGLSPQPRFGVFVGAYGAKAVASPNNSFKEIFSASRFESVGNTTGNWDLGSSACYFSSGQRAQSEIVYLGSELVKQVTITAQGSTVTNLLYYVSPNSGANFEAAPLGSVYNITNAGSVLMWRALENAGGAAGTIRARLDDLTVDYILGSPLV